jgi:hypothetical protein
MDQDLSRLIDSVKDHPESDFVGAQSEELVMAAELRLGLSFPSSYREFVLHLGAGNIGSEEIYGVFRPDFDESGIPDAVWATLHARSDLGLAESLVMIGYDGGEIHYVLECHATEDGRSPVLAWIPGNPPAVSEVAADFSAYLEQLLKMAG